MPNSCLGIAYNHAFRAEEQLTVNAERRLSEAASNTFRPIQIEILKVIESA